MSSVVCSAFNCGSSNSETAHKFPVDEPVLLQQWLEAIEKPTWNPGKENFLCSEHFTVAVDENDGFQFVKQDAVPSLFHSLPKPKTLFPSDVPYRFLMVKEIEEHSCKGFLIEAKLCIDDEEKFYDWLKLHEAIAKVKYRMLQKPQQSMKNLSFKSEYVCRHSASSSCSAKLLVRIRSQSLKFSRPSASTYSCTVVLYHLHNHRVDSNTFGPVDRLPATTLSEEMQRKLMEIFRGGYTAEDALALHQNDTIEEHPDDYGRLLIDTSVCPDLESIQKFYEKYVDTEGEWNFECCVDALEKETEKINGDEGKTQVQRIGERELVVAICTPLMQRAHSLKTSGETVFCYGSPGAMAGCKSHVYVLMTYSGSEGLPLGVVLTTSDEDSVVRAGFRLLAEVLPDKAFSRYGRVGPEIFFAGHDTPEEKALQSIYPDGTVLLCSHSLAMSLWRWLWDPENGVEDADCCPLFQLLLDIVKMKDEEEFNRLYDAAVKNDTATKYPGYIQKLQEVKDLSTRWAMRFKNEFADRDKEISAFEMANSVLRDPMFKGRAYNPTQRLRLLSQDVESYLKQKINHCINNTLDKFLPASFPADMKKVDDLESVLLPSGQHSVHNTDTGATYFVDTETCLCSCPLGLRGCRCRHQYAAMASNKLDIHHSIPNEDNIKKELHWIATNSMNSLFGTMLPEVPEGDLGSDMDDEEYDPRRESLQQQKKAPKPKSPKRGLMPKEEAKAILDRIVKDIVQRYDTNPLEYHRAIVAMAVNYQSLHYDMPIMNALRNFGK